jgi:hypothetical protein
MISISEPDRRSYYQAAMAGLRYVEALRPSGRRFCPQGDARWSAFQGSLTATDRIDLLLRDADAQWPSAFGARAVFDLRAVAEDEPFGAEWTALDAVEAEELWRRQRNAAPIADAFAAISAVLDAWERPRQPFATGSVAANDRIGVAGASAIAALIEAFVAGRDLDWADQVVCVATDRPGRQLAAMAAALLNGTRATVLVAVPDESEFSGRRILVSDDAVGPSAAALRARAR